MGLRLRVVSTKCPRPESRSRASVETIQQDPAQRRWLLSNRLLIFHNPHELISPSPAPNYKSMSSPNNQSHDSCSAPD
ncbi:hypothetical protein CEXT_736331 [Caerostris extrusa]|uniref:Uncharacterized protein n=1 Tax=Caerostris extrusa TaxID=172846 RepID=A0AAV4QCJ2_CAEEX|nr:hypothetical protein CEXT_736331 [Caerostris extrusa]